MKTLFAILAVLPLLAVAAVAQPVQPFYGCETIDQGGYLTFADATCPAAVTSAQADYDPGTGAPLNNK
jgi:hypothetical protein